MALCELCSGPSSLYCASDSAFLCDHCDSKVHNANFLVASHVRQLLCSLCNGLSADFFSGSDHSLRRRPICTSCSPDTFSDCEDDDDSLSSFSSSDDRRLRKLRKISSDSTTLTYEDSTSPPLSLGGRVSPRRRITLRSMQNVDEEAEGVFVHWSRNFGADGRAVASSASHALLICVGRVAGLPFRVALAASFWFGLRMCGVSTWQQLRRLEEISGVPAKTILAVQSKLTRALRVDLKEGWDECSA